MGRYVFKLPDVGEGIAEAEIVNWHVAVGDTIDEDQPLVDVMTDKATVEITSPVAGKITALNGNPGERQAIGSALVVLEVEGPGNAAEEAPAPAAEPAAAEAAPAQAPAAAPAPAPVAEPAPARVPFQAPPSRPAARTASPATAPAAPRAPGDKPIASPAVRGRAWDLGIELQFVPGTGPGGRITHEDLDAYVASRGQPVAGGGRGLVQKHGVEEIKVIGLRRRIAERLQDTKRRIPHFSYVEEVDVTALEELRVHLNGERRGDRPKLTLLPFLVRALVTVLARRPQINAVYDDAGGVVYRYEAVHAGIATQTPSGLMVPVLRHAEAMDVWTCAAEISRLAAAAREGKAKPDELSGSTITITSLGAMGGIVSTPVINSPEVAIVGVNKIVERPVVRQGQVVVRKMMNLSSSFDHRIVDGWDAAEFVQDVRSVLEQPATLFMEGL
ncbi:dihydrolipoamide acetyltransferase family protein [Arenibaculum sp.]|uniref:dihydrolipoamide acetyltransferase family protein n=1 Tax=Arenibaculum sp. TaxID=2865862 RepID=UPI002E0FEB1B|nr:dihydrolipoamide acetyltransferase family protein [Arenibaculum sp.]